MNPLMLFFLKIGASVVLRSAVKFSKTKIDDHVIIVYDEIVDLLKALSKGEDVDLDEAEKIFIGHIEAIKDEVEKSKKKKEEATLK